MRALVLHKPHDLRLERISLDDASLGPHDVRLRMTAGGICGSDLHYYHHGGFGAVRIREPITLGHEASGYVEAIGKDVKEFAVGDLVAVNPSAPCGHCAACRTGFQNHCDDMRFNGSAMRFPHVQGLFRETMTIAADRVFVMRPGVSPAEAALCEPLAVALHAVRQLGDVNGKTVLVSGCGPIGALVITAVKLAGAARIIATDVTAHSLAVAARSGATDCLDVAADPSALTPYAESRGQIDAAIECSGNPHALAPVVAAIKPKGRLVLVGLGGDASLPVNMVVAKELNIAGAFRFAEEFARAAALIGGGRIDLSHVISATYPIERAAEAFAHASDRSRATKVSITLSSESFV